MRWTFSVLVAGLVLASLPARAGADVLYADIDHDGVSDTVSIQTIPKTGIRIWLSHAKRTIVLATRRPIMRVAASDIDGDGGLDLIASDTAARVHVWHRTGRGQLKPVKPRHTSRPDGLARSGQVHNAPDDSPGAVVDEGSSAALADAVHPGRSLSFDALDLAGTTDPPLASAIAARLVEPRGPPLTV